MLFRNIVVVFMVLSFVFVSNAFSQTMQESKSLKSTESMHDRVSQKVEMDDLKPFQSETGDYTIKFPESWEIKKDFMGTDVIALAPQEGENDMFRENVNIISTKLDSPMSQKDYFDLNMKSLEELLSDFKLDDKQTVDIDGIEALKVVYTHKMGNVEAKVLQYLFLDDNKAFVITLTGDPAEFDKYKPEFDTIIQSFKLNN